MEYIPENRLLNYKPDTLHFLRNQYGFDTMKRVNDAIDAIQEWATKQEHFGKKSFDRNFLERLLINNKGLVEKSKRKLDKLCTIITLIPDFFDLQPIDKEAIFGSFFDAISIEMTQDYGRVHFVKVLPGNLNSSVYQQYCKYFVLIQQYLQNTDYCNYITIIVDFADDSLVDFIKALDIPALRKCVEIAFAAFSMRIKAIHLISSSKAVDLFISIVKPILGEKIGNRLINHLRVETIYDYVPREILPKEYGGNDKPLSQKRDELYEELYSPEFTKHREQFNEARTNEALRQKDKFNADYLGISGTFRTLTVD